LGPGFFEMLDIRFRSVIAALIFFGATGWVADASAQSVSIVGIGATTCADFIVAIEGNPRVEREYFAWAQGFMSGLLIRAPAGKDENLELMPPSFPLQRQAQFLRDFCSTHVQSDFGDAASTLYRTLRSPPG